MRSGLTCFEPGLDAQVARLWHFSCIEWLVSFQQLLTMDSGISLVQDTSAVMNQSLEQSKILSAALQGLSPLQTQFPATNIGNQLKQVAQIMQVRSTLGLQRQIFFCSLGGFDTHSDHLNAQVSLYSQLDPAMSAFYNSTVGWESRRKLRRSRYPISAALSSRE